MQPQEDNQNYIDYLAGQGQAAAGNAPVQPAANQVPPPAAGGQTVQPQGPPAQPQPGQVVQPAPQNSPAGGPQQPPAAPQPAQPAAGSQAGPVPIPPQHPEEAGKARKVAISAQESLLIAEVLDGVVIMKDGSFRAVIMCQSVNFDLMSNDERESIEFAYQGFLNSLDFPIQIVVRSLRVNLENYVQKLAETRNNQQNLLLQLLMDDYMAYVNYLLQTSNIMDKQFFVVVPYFPPLTAQTGLSSGAKKFSNIFKKSSEPVTINENDFARYRSELTQRVRVVLNGLHQAGIQSVPLNTQELIELYYSFYNPVTAANQGLSNIQDLEASIVTKGQGQAPRPDLSGVNR